MMPTIPCPSNAVMPVEAASFQAEVKVGKNGLNSAARAMLRKESSSNRSLVYYNHHHKSTCTKVATTTTRSSKWQDPSNNNNNKSCSEVFPGKVQKQPTTTQQPSPLLHPIHIPTFVLTWAVVDACYYDTTTDDDAVSELYDDPEIDDEDFLPQSTIDVLATFLDGLEEEDDDDDDDSESDDEESECHQDELSETYFVDEYVVCSHQVGRQQEEEEDDDDLSFMREINEWWSENNIDDQGEDDEQDR